MKFENELSNLALRNWIFETKIKDRFNVSKRNYCNNCPPTKKRKFCNDAFFLFRNQSANKTIFIGPKRGCPGLKKGTDMFIFSGTGQDFQNPNSDSGIPYKLGAINNTLLWWRDLLIINWLINHKIQLLNSTTPRGFHRTRINLIP